MEHRVATVVSEEQGDAQQPRAPRTNLLLAATIEGEVAGPVRIRNLSESGALIEGQLLPQVGERLTLRRAALAVGATVMWRGAGKCGVQFDRRVAIAHWAKGISTPRDQAQVDAMQAAVRAGLSSPAPATEQVTADAAPAAAAASGMLERRVAEELAYIARLIETIGDDLADEPAVIHRHPSTLQNFDLAVQILEHLSAVLTAEDRAKAIGEIGMADLRARLTRRANF